MTLALILPPKMAPRWRERFLQIDPAIDVRMWDDLGDPAAIRYALCWRAPAGAAASLPNLRVIFSMGAGVDHILSDPTTPDVPIVRIVDADLTNRMSEYVVMHVLMHHRRQRLYDRQQRERLWHGHEQWPASKMRVGIMGIGELGSDAASKVAMLGFQVAGWSRSPKTLEGIECFHGEAGLNTFLARTDILVVLLPLTPDTKGILNRALFAKLAKDGPLGGGVVINAGRGGLQVATDIVSALDAGDLVAASLDVFETEPLDPASPLWQREDIIITPHNAADSDPDALCAYVLDQIRAHQRGSALRNVVDPQRGY